MYSIKDRSHWFWCIHFYTYLHMKREGNTRLALLLPTIVVLLGSCGLSLLLAVYDTLHGAPVAHIHFPMSYPLSIITNQPQVACTETNERLTTHKNGSTLGKRQANCGDDERTPKQPRRGRVIPTTLKHISAIHAPCGNSRVRIKTYCTYIHNRISDTLVIMHAVLKTMHVGMGQPFN